MLHTYDTLLSGAVASLYDIQATYVYSPSIDATAAASYGLPVDAT